MSRGDGLHGGRDWKAVEPIGLQRVERSILPKGLCQGKAKESAQLPLAMQKEKRTLTVPSLDGDHPLARVGLIGVDMRICVGVLGKGVDTTDGLGKLATQI